jgi:hypothetical protein
MSRLTAAERSTIPTSEFAEPADRKYPVDTAKRARTALGLVGMHGSPAAKAKVRAKVHADYPGIGESK